MPLFVFKHGFGCHGNAVINGRIIDFCLVGLEENLAEPAREGNECATAIVHELAFPHHKYIPSHLVQQLVVAFIACFVVLEFCCPKVDIGFWPTVLVTAIVCMPETSIDKNRRAVLGENNVGAAWQAFHMEPVAITLMPEPASYSSFGLGVLTLDVAHASMPLLASHSIGHSVLSVDVLTRWA